VSKARTEALDLFFALLPGWPRSLPRNSNSTGATHGDPPGVYSPVRWSKTRRHRMKTLNFGGQADAPPPPPLPLGHFLAMNTCAKQKEESATGRKAAIYQDRKEASLPCHKLCNSAPKARMRATACSTIPATARCQSDGPSGVSSSLPPPPGQ
jgi:hypothetical protein